MATRVGLRERVRRELGDTLAPFVWSDDQVYDLLGDALSEFGQLAPIEDVLENTMTVGVREYSAPVGTLRVVRVEWPSGTFIAEDATVPEYVSIGDVPASGLAQAWRYNATSNLVTVRNAPASAAKFRVHYLGGRALPANDTDAVSVPARDEGLVCLMACRAAWELRRMEDAKRGLRTPGLANPFAGRVERLLERRRRLARGGTLRVTSDA